MLVQFLLKNVLSFKEETILDMTAINAYKEHQCNLIDYETKEKYLRVAAIYGANASGKSNIYMAMTYFQRIIAESLNNVEDGEETAIQTYYQPFSFDSEKENSEFQIVNISMVLNIIQTALLRNGYIEKIYKLKGIQQFLSVQQRKLNLAHV